MAEGIGNGDPVLKRAIEHYIERYSYPETPGINRAYTEENLPEEEQRALQRLSKEQRFELHDLAFAELLRRQRIGQLHALEKYMRLYLLKYWSYDPEGVSHLDIRAALTPTERALLDGIDRLDVPKVWKEVVKQSPEIQDLLKPPHKATPSEAVSATADIYRATRTGGLMIFAPSGWGKSRLLGRSICYQYAVDRIGSVTLDIVGGTIDNVLDKITRHKPLGERQEIASRIRYCNMAGERIGDETYVSSWPMLVKRFPNENLHTTTQRIVDLIRTTDKNLATASIQGFNRLAPLLTSVTMVLSALGLPLALAHQVLADPATWKKRIQWVDRHMPEAEEAVTELLEFYELDGRKQEERAEVLRNQLRFLRFDPVSRAMFSTSKPLIDWDEVATEGLQVYIDLRFETSQKAMEMKLFWVWNSLMEYIRSRGSSGRDRPPLAVVIDELSYFVRGQQLNTDAISEEFREFVQVRRRNANILLTAATQERAELPPAMQSACLQLPSHLYGATSNPDTAIENAQRWYKKDPMRRKSGDMYVWLQIMQSYKYFKKGAVYSTEAMRLVDLEDFVLWNQVTPLSQPLPKRTYMSLEEQDYENSRNFLELPKGEWLFAKSPAEGVPPTDLQHITTAKLDDGMWVRENVVSEFRRLLMQEHGIPMSPVLSELTNLSRKQPPPEAAGGGTVPQPPKPPAPSHDAAASPDTPDGATGRRREL